MKALAADRINRARAPRVPVATPQLAPTYLRAHWVNFGWLLAGSLLVSIPLFYRALSGQIVADHEVHVRLIQRGVETGIWPAHFLFHAIVYGLSGFRHDFVSLACAALVVLTMCVIAKSWLTYVLLVRHGRRLPNPAFEDAYGLSHTTLLVLVTATLMLSAPIVRPWWTHRIYLGQISPNIWHNPTSVVCWPLVILLFFAAVAFVRRGRPRELVAVGLLSAASVLIKPNYFLAFAPVYTLLTLRRFGLSRIWLLSQAALIPTVMLLCWQVATSFLGPNAMRPDLHIAWMPLAVWHIYSNSILVSLMFSLAFPLSYLVIYRRSLQNRDMLLFAWAVMLCALAWTGCFAEVHADGTLDGDFNFSWGSHLALFVLFLVTAIDMLDSPAAMSSIARSPAAGRIARLPWWLLGAHGASGALWIVRQAIGRGYG
jgi:hypothetical protein